MTCFILICSLLWQWICNHGPKGKECLVVIAVARDLVFLSHFVAFPFHPMLTSELTEGKLVRMVNPLYILEDSYVYLVRWQQYLLHLTITCVILLSHSFFFFFFNCFYLDGQLAWIVWIYMANGLWFMSDSFKRIIFTEVLTFNFKEATTSVK